jgi:hypothetical protein
MSAPHPIAGPPSRPRNGFFRSVGSMLAVFGAARNAAAAAEAGRRPDKADLRLLGIDPTAFDGVRF